MPGAKRTVIWRAGVRMRREGFILSQVLASCGMTNRSKHSVIWTLRALFGEPPSTWGELRLFVHEWLTPRVRQNTGGKGGQRQTLAYSALLGISVVTIGRLVSLSELSIPLTLSILAFALAIPLLAGTVYTIISEQRAEYKYEVSGGLAFLTDPLGVITSFGGLVLVFVHFSLIAGILFTVGSVLALITYLQSIWVLAVTQANSNQAQDSQPSSNRSG